MKEMQTNVILRAANNNIKSDIQFKFTHSKYSIIHLTILLCIVMHLPN